jgi:hypothetical protein
MQRISFRFTNLFIGKVKSMQIVRRQLPWISVLVLFLVLGGSARALFLVAGQTENLLAVADQLLPIVSRLRGLSQKAAIQKGIKTREEISQYLTEEVSANYEKEELRSEGILLKRLGLIPPGMDYAGFILKLLTEQVGGYYDPEKKALFIAGWLSVEDQKPALVHELTHALQDQYFDLAGMTRRDRKLHNGDLAMAHQAIAEGDATAVMLDYILEPAGRNYLQLPDLVFIMRSQLALMNSQFDVLKSAPDYIREMLVFPYSYGTAFLQKARAHNEPWSAIDKIYADLPASTEQIMHPDKYLAGRDKPRPVTVEDPVPQLGHSWKVTFRNVMGEFSLYLLLKVFVQEDQAAKAAEGWGGDQIILVEEEGTGKSAVICQSTWDDKIAADRFSAALSSWFQKKYPQGRKVDESESGFGLISGGEYSSIQRRGDDVRLIVGLPESHAPKFSGR